MQDSQIIDLEINDHLSKFRDSFLWAATKGDRFSEVEQLTSIGANPYWCGSDGKSSIIVAIDHRNYQILECLMSTKAKISCSVIREIETYARNLSDNEAFQIVHKYSNQEAKSRNSSQSADNRCLKCESTLAALEDERQERAELEKSLSSTKHHFTKILEDSMKIHNDVRCSLLARDKLKTEMVEMQQKIDTLEGIDGFIDMSLDKLEAMESTLRSTLDRIALAKRREIAKMESQMDQRLCICCQSGDKNVLLLPCRHLCLCSACSSRPDLNTCPICRQTITDRIQVYN